MYRSKLLWEWGNLVEECQPPKYPHSTGIQKKINPRVSFEKHSGSKLKTGWRTDAWTCPQPAFLLVSQYYEDHHRCQHSRWTDALTVDSGHVQSQPCLSGGSPPGGRPRYALHTLPADITTQLVPSLLKYTSWKT